MSIELQSSNDENVEKEILFTIDDKPYYIDKKPKFNVALKTLRLMKTEGEEAAMLYMMEAVLGKESFDALCDYEDLTQETFQQIVAAAQKVALGGLDVPKGN